MKPVEIKGGIASYKLSKQFLANYEEGFWRSPSGKVIETCLSYEGEMINVGDPEQPWHSSIYPCLWDLLMADWTYLGKKR